MEGTFQQRWVLRSGLGLEYGATVVYDLAWRWLERQGAIYFFFVIFPDTIGFRRPSLALGLEAGSENYFMAIATV